VGGSGALAVHSPLHAERDALASVNPPSWELRAGAAVSSRHLRFVLLTALSLSLCGAAGCRNPRSTLEVSKRFDELILPADAHDGLSTARFARVAVANEIRPVVSQRLTLVHAPAVEVAGTGPQPFRTGEIDGLQSPLPAIEAMVRFAGGEWQRRNLVLQGTEERRFVGVDFLAADLGKTLEVAVTGWGPPSELHASTGKFLVPPDSRLRFATAVRSFTAGSAQFRVSVESDGEAAVLLYKASIDASQESDQRGWQDVEVALSAYAGREVRLRFDAYLTAPLAVENAPFELPKPLVSEPALVTPARRRDRDYDIILISIDTLRADHVGAYGYRRPISPTIDRLAASGTLFENVIAAWPETSASHMTLFTALYPSVHGIGLSKWGERQLLPRELILAEVLRHEGFTTGAITGDGLVLASAGFARGFDSYREFKPLRTGGPSLVEHPIDGLLVAAHCAGEARQVFAKGADWLRQHRHDRFLHTYQVHQRAAPGERYEALRQQLAHDGRLPEIPSPDHFLATYDAAIAYTDDALNGFLQQMEELDLTRRTLVIFTSDHGESFFEHGWIFGHGQSLYDPELRVPLIFYGPGFIPAGRRIAEQIGLIDVAPTILDLLHAPPLPQAQGHSAADLILGHSARQRAPVICELGDDWRAVRTNASKLIRVDGGSGLRLEFYDLRGDPMEARPLSSTNGNPEMQEALRLLQNHDLECQSLRKQLETAVEEPAAPVAAHLNEETREHLRALGYEIPRTPLPPRP